MTALIAKLLKNPGFLTFGFCVAEKSLSDICRAKATMLTASVNSGREEYFSASETAVSA